MFYIKNIKIKFPLSVDDANWFWFYCMKGGVLATLTWCRERQEKCYGVFHPVDHGFFFNFKRFWDLIYQYNLYRVVNLVFVYPDWDTYIQDLRDMGRFSSERQILCKYVFARSPMGERVKHKTKILDTLIASIQPMNMNCDRSSLKTVLLYEGLFNEEFANRYVAEFTPSIEIFFFVGWTDPFKVMENIRHYWGVEVHPLKSSTRYMLSKLHYKLSIALWAFSISQSPENQWIRVGKLKPHFPMEWRGGNKRKEDVDLETTAEMDNGVVDCDDKGIRMDNDLLICDGIEYRDYTSYIIALQDKAEQNLKNNERIHKMKIFQPKMKRIVRLDSAPKVRKIPSGWETKISRVPTRKFCTYGSCLVPSLACRSELGVGRCGYKGCGTSFVGIVFSGAYRGKFIYNREYRLQTTLVVGRGRCGVAHSICGFTGYLVSLNIRYRRFIGVVRFMSILNREMLRIDDRGFIVVPEDCERDTWTSITRINKLLDTCRDKLLEYKARSEMLGSESGFMRSAKLVLNAEGYCLVEKQICLEALSVNHEKLFISFLLKEYEDKQFSVKHRLFYKTLNQCLPSLIKGIPKLFEKIKGQLLILDMGKGRRKGVVKYSSEHDMLVFVRNLEKMRVDHLASLIFTFLVKKVGLSGYADQMSLIEGLIDHLISHSGMCATSTGDKTISREGQCYFSLSSVDKINIGQPILVTTIEICSKIFDTARLKVGVKKTQSVVLIKDEFLSVLADLTFNMIRLPMIAPPKLLTYRSGNLKVVDEDNCDFNLGEVELARAEVAPLEGGCYYTQTYNDIFVQQGLIHRNALEGYVSSLSPLQIKTVNYLNQVKFSFNQDMLDVALREWEDDNSLLFEGYHRPYREDTHDTEQCKDASSSQKSKYLLARIKHNARFWLMRNTLNIGLLLRDYVVYFPVFMDFRGRIYPLSNYFSYQCGDLARSLISFYWVREQQLGSGTNCGDMALDSGWDYLLVYLANVYGEVKKKSKSTRIKWSEDNYREMFRLFNKNPEVFRVKYLAKATEKAQFISCLIYLNRVGKADGIGVESYKDVENSLPVERKYLHFPVLFDATCSGIQHLSALTSDIELGSLVNLTANQEPMDFYGYCANIITEVINNLENPALRKTLSQLKITRNMLKLPVMTIPYNIGMKSLTKNITDLWVTTFVPPILKDGKPSLHFSVDSRYTHTGLPLCLNGHEAGKFGSIVFNTVKGIMHPIEELNKYFDQMIEILSILNKPIFWVTPSGMRVCSSRLKTRAIEVKSPFLRKTKPITINIPTTNYDYSAIRRGLMANLIHSLDAANINILIDKVLSYNKHTEADVFIPLYTIHDCFASASGSMKRVEKLVKLAFSSMYFDTNYLEVLNRSLVDQFKSYGVKVYEKEGKQWAILPDSIDSNVELGANHPPSCVKVEARLLPILPSFDWDNKHKTLKGGILESEYFIT